MKVLDVALLGGGALLISAAIKDKSPRDIVAENVGGAKPKGPTAEDIASDEENRARARDAVKSGTVTSN